MRRPAVVWLLFGVAIVAAGFAATRLVAAAEVETAPYRVELSDGAFEIRDYPELVVAEVRRQGSREGSVNSAFRALFSYIAGKGREGEKIAMTAPVTQSVASIPMTTPVTQNSGGDGTWTVAFIMPSGSTLDDLPRPAGTDVRLVTRPAQRMAAIRFSGRWTDASFAERTAELMRWIEARGLKPIGAATYAYYNAPFTPWFMRRNEVLVPIAR